MKGYSDITTDSSWVSKKIISTFSLFENKVSEGSDMKIFKEVSNQLNEEILIFLREKLDFLTQAQLITDFEKIRSNQFLSDNQKEDAALGILFQYGERDERFRFKLRTRIIAYLANLKYKVYNDKSNS